MCKKNNLHHFILSFRTERSDVKILGSIAQPKTWCIENLRFALDDNTDATYFYTLLQN